jgi:chromosome segregation ATPase
MLETTQSELSAMRAKLADTEMSIQNLTHTAAGAAKDAESARRRTQEVEAERQEALEAVKQAQAGREVALQGQLRSESAQARAESERTLAVGKAETAAKERDGAMAAMRQMAAERDAAVETLRERDQWVDQLAAAVTEQRDTLASLSAERDAARTAADQARNLIDELTRQLRTIMPGAQPLADAQLSALGGSRDPHNGFSG